MTAIRLTGYITDKGELRVRLPAGLPEGQVQVIIEVASPEAAPVEMMPVEPKSGAEIAASDAIGGWAHLNITDSAAFVEDLRREEEERRWRRD